MSTIDLQHALDVAIDAAKKAAQHAVERQKELSTIKIDTKSSPRDFVTAADRECQEMIIERIRKEYPDHRFIAEEEGADDLGDPASPFAWVVDPIDGTVPFIHNRDNFGVIIALREAESTQLGVIYLPRKDELFHGVRGQGSFFNGEPVTLRETRDMNESILCSNFIQRSKEIDGTMMVSLPLCASMENYGSAAQELGEILKGNNDGAFFLGPRLWDLAAGFMLIEEAGGHSYFEFTEPGNVRSAIRGCTSTAPIFEELKAFVLQQM